MPSPFPETAQHFPEKAGPVTAAGGMEQICHIVSTAALSWTIPLTAAPCATRRSSIPTRLPIRHAVPPFPKERGQVEPVKNRDVTLLYSLVLIATSVSCGLLNFFCL